MLKNNAKIIVFLTLLILIRVFLFLTLSPRLDPDSSLYIHHIENLYEGFGFSVRDYVDNNYKPTAYRPPLFQYLSYLITKFFLKDKSMILSSISIINFLSSLSLFIISFVISYYLTKSIPISTLSIILTLLNINMFYNSTLVLTDTFFAAIVSLTIITCTIAIKNNNKILFFLTGICLGSSILTRSILKFYPIVLIIYLIYINKDIKKALMLTLITLFGVSIIIFPWILRNSKKMGFIGIETNQGLNTLWSTSSLVEIKEKDLKEPMIYEIKKIIIENRKESPWPMGAEIKARKELNLSEVEASKYFQKIGVETILSHPFSFIKIFLRNLLNNITSATSELKMIDILFYNGYYELQHNIMIRFENIEKSDKKDISFKEFLLILPNFIFRIIHLISFTIAMIGGYLFTKKKKEIGIFLLSFIWYVLLLTSAVASYDRYRLPFEIILNFFISFAFVKIHNIWKEKHS